MIVKNVDASQYKCCMMDKPCDGELCMAWRTQFDWVFNETGVVVDVNKLDDFGFCGLANR